MYVKYNVQVKFLDDGKHLPFHFYSGTCYSDTDVTNDEIKKLIIESVKKNYKWHNGNTLENDMTDPAFVGVNVYDIIVCKPFNSMNVYIDGPARIKDII